MKVDRDAILTCSTCGVEGSHELLYLSEHLHASRCVNCGKTQTYSGNIYAGYARDLAGRTGRLPGKFAREAFKLPASVMGWPFKVLRKPFRLIKEVDQVTAFERSRRRPPMPGQHIQ